MHTAEMPDEIKEKIEEYFILIESGRGKTSKANELRAELEELLGKSHSELQRADMMLNFF